MWGLPGMHLTNLELAQRLKSGDDRQFGANMDVTGDVSEREQPKAKWEDTHHIGLRTDIWKPDPEDLQRAAEAVKKQRQDLMKKQVRLAGKSGDDSADQIQKLTDNAPGELSANDLEKRRLVLKLFRNTGKRIRWCGTIEEVSTTEVHNSLGSKHPLLSLAVILPRYEYLTVNQQNHRTFRIPALFTCCYFDETHDRMWHVVLRRKWFSVGTDFVIEANGKPIGEIDGRLFSVGYNASIQIHEPLLAKDTRFLDLMTLFASSVGYHKAMRKSIARRVAATIAGCSDQHLVESEELWLKKNPRRTAA